MLRFAFSLSLLLSWIVAVTYAQSLSPSISLPPADPTGNDSCAFTDRDSLIDRVQNDWQNYNISLLVQTCPGVCPLVYGVGNPDISGVGAMSSYAIQGATGVLFGPILAILALFLSNNVASDSFFSVGTVKWISKYFVPVAQSVQQANILTAISVLTASVIRMKQIAPLAEVDFVVCLAQYQFWIALACASSYFPIHEASKGGLFAIGIYVVASEAMFFAIIFMRKFPSSKAKILEQITRYCVSLEDWPVPAVSFELGSGRQFLSFLEGFGIGGGPSFVIVFTCGYIFRKFRRQIVAFGKKLWDLYASACRHLRFGPKRLAAIIAISFVTAIWLWYVAFLLKVLQRQRKQLQELSGAAYQDNQWGFGQVTAMLVWLPTLKDCLLALGGAIHHYFKHQRDSTAVPGWYRDATARGEPPANALPSTAAGGRPWNPMQYRRPGNDSSQAPTPTEGIAPDVSHQDASGTATTHSSRDAPGQRPNPPSREVSTEQLPGDLRTRTTWPRNESGTYLPTSETSETSP